VLPSIVTEVVKQVIAQFNATALLTQREQVSRKIKDLLAERAREFAIVLEVRGCGLYGYSAAQVPAESPH
jgi:prohibitin 2